MDGTGRGGRLRSFAIGGVVGAAGAIATLRRASRRSRTTLAGLEAFESAPCFLELADHGEARQRDGGEAATEFPSPT